MGGRERAPIESVSSNKPPDIIQKHSRHIISHSASMTHGPRPSMPSSRCFLRIDVPGRHQHPSFHRSATYSLYSAPHYSTAQLLRPITFLIYLKRALGRSLVHMCDYVGDEWSRSHGRENLWSKYSNSGSKSSFNVQSEPLNGPIFSPHLPPLWL